jgi:hypothetical protein
VVVRRSAFHDQAGNRWVVRRRWTPRWTRIDVDKRLGTFHRRKTTRPADRARSWWEVIDIPFDAIDDIRALVLIPVMIVVLLILWFAVIPVLLILFDVLIVIVLFLAGITARVLLRRPWTVVATSSDGVEIEREVVGWRASRDEMATLCRELEQGSIALPSPFEPPTPSTPPPEP